jgi:hypothetical protein
MGDRVRGEEAPGVNVQENNGERSVMGDDQTARRLAEIDGLNNTIEGLRTLNTRQETAISVMRERIFELEMEIVNSRCAIGHTH